MRYLLKRLAYLVPVLLAVTALTYVVVALLPGDAARSLLGPDAPREDVEGLRAALGLDQPPLERYWDWMSGVATGDLGRSVRTNQPVMEALVERLPVTLELMLVSQLLALGIAIPLGVAAAWRAGGAFDRVTSGGAFALLSVPSFMLAIVLIYVFAVHWQLLPASGYERLGNGIGANLRSLMLPAVTLAVGESAVYMRLLRSDMIATLQEDYIQMARAKGLTTSWILFRHALRPSMFTLLTVSGLTIGRLIGGTVIVESIFALPGLGRLLIDSIGFRDFVMVQGVVTFIAVAYVIVNLIVDLLYFAVDPRVRHEPAVR